MHPDFFTPPASETTRVIPFSDSFRQSIEFRVSFILGPPLSTGCVGSGCPFNSIVYLEVNVHNE